MRKVVFIAASIAVLWLAVQWLPAEYAIWLKPHHWLAELATLKALVTAHPLIATSVFFAVYVVMVAVALPGAAVLTVLAGALFGWWGVVIISFASSLGALLCFLLVRWLFRAALEARFAAQLATIQEGVKREGAFYLFALRLTPVFPFFVINALFGLTHMRAFTYYWVSQAGMLLGTMVYVRAGMALEGIDAEAFSLGQVMSVDLFIAFALLGLLPLVSKKLVAFLRARRVYRRFQKPRTFDYNLIVIGGGSAGLVGAYIANETRAKVLLVERARMGGDCLNHGCVPSKALLHQAKKGATFTEAMAAVTSAIATIAPVDSHARYQGLGVDTVEGTARVISPWEVEVAERTMTARNVLIATGARPYVPPIEGLADTPYLTSDTLWQLDMLPAHLIILGGGAIGCEMAEAFAAFGAKVTLVSKGALLARSEPRMQQAMQTTLTARGVCVHTEAAVVRVVHDKTKTDNAYKVVAEQAGAPLEILGDALLVACGRKANTEGFGLEDIGVECLPNGMIATNATLQTNIPNMYAAGDVAGPYQLTHHSGHQGAVSALNAGLLPIFKANKARMPAVVYTTPEFASLGETAAELTARGAVFARVHYDFAHLDRAITDEATDGFMEVFVAPGSKGRILGVHIVAARAGEMLAEFSLAMQHGIGLKGILNTTHAYPTYSEAASRVAGVWRKQRKPSARMMAILAWVQAWRRG